MTSFTKNLSRTETLKFTIKKIQNLLVYGETVSDRVEAHGFAWQLKCMHRQGSVSLQLINLSGFSDEASVKAVAVFRISPSLLVPFAHTFDANNRYGETKVPDFSELENKSGSFQIQANLRIDFPAWRPTMIPENTSVNIQILKSAVGTDTIFSVGETQEKFRAHKCFLKQRSRALYELVKDTDDNQEIEIPSISGSTFQIMLEYIYAAILPDISKEKNTEATKQILLAANTYELIFLKLHLEAEVVDKMLTANNAAEWLLFADGHACPLLKETCMDRHAGDMVKMKNSASWRKVQESRSLLVDLLVHVTTRLDPLAEFYSVCQLRENLQSAGLEVDGTKEMLLKRLKASTANSENQ